MGKKKLPSYRRHPNNQAFYEYCGQRTYLGVYDSPESHEEFARVIAQIKAGGPGAVERRRSGKPATIHSLSLAYLDHAATYYSEGGRPSKEYHGMKTALARLAKFCGPVHGADFGPAMLIEFQTWMTAVRFERVIGRGKNKQTITRPYSRPTINKTVNRIKRFFRWCSKKELVPPELYSKLVCVDALEEGRCSAPEPDDIEPVPYATVVATIPYLQPTTAVMVQVQMLCGMRPQDVCSMRRCDIDFTGDIWVYRVQRHKNSWRGHELHKAIPKAAQALLRPYLTDSETAYIFSPRRSEELRNAARKAARATPMTPSHAARARQANKRERPHGESYSVDSYRRAIGNAIAKAARAGVVIEKWCPLRLRHTIATHIRQVIGEEACQIYLGHASLDTTKIYTAKTVTELVVVARALDHHWAKSSVPALLASDAQTTASSLAGSPVHRSV